jgi:hypothetical protein
VVVINDVDAVADALKGAHAGVVSEEVVTVRSRCLGITN